MCIFLSFLLWSIVKLTSHTIACAPILFPLIGHTYVLRTVLHLLKLAYKQQDFRLY